MSAFSAILWFIPFIILPARSFDCIIHKLMCKWDRLLIYSCLSAFLKTTICVPPKISSWGYPLTYNSEDITKSVKPWVAARSQGQPWQMQFSTAPCISIVCLSNPKGLSAELRTPSEIGSDLFHSH